MKAKINNVLKLEAVLWDDSFESYEDLKELLGYPPVSINGKLKIFESMHSARYIPTNSWIVKLPSGKIQDFPSDNFRELFSIDD